MKRAQIRNEIDRIHRDYPILWDFMECYCNSCCMGEGMLYPEIEDAVRDFARLNTEISTHRLLDQARRAREDAALNAIMCDGLATSWGGMGLEDKGWANLIAALEKYLPDSGGRDARHVS